MKSPALLLALAAYLLTPVADPPGGKPLQGSGEPIITRPKESTFFIRPRPTRSPNSTDPEPPLPSKTFSFELTKPLPRGHVAVVTMRAILLEDYGDGLNFRTRPDLPMRTVPTTVDGNGNSLQQATIEGNSANPQERYRCDFKVHFIAPEKHKPEHVAFVFGVTVFTGKPQPETYRIVQVKYIAHHEEGP